MFSVPIFAIPKHESLKQEPRHPDLNFSTKRKTKTGTHKCFKLHFLKTLHASDFYKIRMPRNKTGEEKKNLMITCQERSKQTAINELNIR